MCIHIRNALYCVRGVGGEPTCLRRPPGDRARQSGQVVPVSVKETFLLHLGANKCLHFSICPCHPCAGAMLIFSVSFQF